MDDPRPDSTAADLWENAPLVGPGRWYGNLSGLRGEGGGACELGGPDAYLRVSVPLRADLRVHTQGSGFVPRVHAAFYAAAEEAGEIHSCARGLPLTVLDLPRGSEVTVAIGVDPEDPAAMLTGAARDEALGFAVDLALRRVLEVGERCDLVGTGRCVGGSLCEPDPEGGDSRCRAIPGDTCADPIDLQIPQQAGLLLADTQRLTDAHHHSCTGLRRAERVYRLILDRSLAPGARLEITADRTNLGLALRSPGCAAAHEIACSEAQPRSSVSFEVGDWPSLGVMPYLFVEVPTPLQMPPAPPGRGGRKPYDIRFEVVDG